MADLADFLGKKKPEIEGEQVQGTFSCMDCNKVSEKALLNYEQKALLWFCEHCEYFNRVGMNV